MSSNGLSNSPVFSALLATSLSDGRERALQATVPPFALAVADGGELLGQATAEGRHECEEA
jgi:hypothetical protein